MSATSKAKIITAIHLVAAVEIYRHLISGGWLTNHYHLNDPDIVNVMLAIFEPIAIASVIAYWISRTRFLYRLILILGAVQIVIGIGFFVLLLWFTLTWHPRLM